MLNAILCIAGVAALSILARAFTNLGTNSLTPKSLINESSRCFNLAVQDTDSSTRILHSAQGLAYLELARKLASDSSLERSTGVIAIDLEKLFKEIIDKKNSK